MDPRRHAPAVQRNKDAILPVLAAALPAQGLLVEIASGSGEHAAYLAPKLPGWRWQPTDLDKDALPGIDAHARDADPDGTAILPALHLDASAGTWPVAAADAMFCANMIHIAPWQACVGMLRGAGRLLPPDGTLVLYGPYLQDGVPTAAGNLSFDSDLRARNPDWGIRPLEEVVSVAESSGLTLVETVSMPANNLTVVFRRI